MAEPRDGNRVAAITVNYNGGVQILECLRSLDRQTYPLQQIWVVDNQSTDGSLEQVCAYFPHVQVIRMGYNAGWGVACNAGIEHSSGDYVLVLNNDAYLDQRCVEEMVQAMDAHPEAGSCAGKVLLWNDPERIEVAGLAIYGDGSSIGRGRLERVEALAQDEEVFGASGSCCLYRRAMLDQVGLYDPDFFLYCEDTDLGWRGQFAGWTCRYVPRAIAYHAHSRSSGGYSDLKAYHVERNRLYLCLKHFPVERLLAGFFLSAYRYLYQVWLARRGSGTLGRYLEGHSLAHGLGTLLRAHRDALRGAPVMLRKRRLPPEARAQIARLYRRYGISTREMVRYE